MKGKTSLILIEQAIMILVLAVIAALCTLAFVWADVRAEENRNQDRAMLEAQSAAEVLKQYAGNLEAAACIHGGTVENGQWQLSFDENWEKSDRESSFLLSVMSQASDMDYLGRATVELHRADGTVLAAVDICWQEDLP